MIDDEHVINTLWIGGNLSLMEQLTLHSFVRFGHHVRLWHYEPISSEIPEEVELSDANLILSRSKVFSYKNKNQYGHGKGSFSGFSDIFRYKLLHDKGGWWVDMDVTCLKPFPKDVSYFFRTHHEFAMVGNVMKTKKNCPAMSACFQRSIETVDAQNTDWNKPISILNEEIENHNLSCFIKDDICNRDWFLDLIPFLISNKAVPENWLFIHWTNENFRSRNWDKNKFKINSRFGKLLFANKVLSDNFTFWQRIKNSLDFISFRKLLNI